MTELENIETDLRSHLSLYQEILAVVTREGQILRSGEPVSDSDLVETKTTLLARLKNSLEILKQHRQYWQALDATARTAHPQIESLMRQSQDLIMRVIVLDRENEQALLRRGLMPARQVPSANRQRPHYVASLYQRGASGIAQKH